ncbi:hypothetical protein JL720_2639 [Aureococcus anophagefferens]|nr:hypothetical protein JL720_2639 [Aureococcus anophagefferens]
MEPLAPTATDDDQAAQVAQARAAAAARRSAPGFDDARCQLHFGGGDDGAARPQAEGSAGVLFARLPADDTRVLASCLAPGVLTTKLEDHDLAPEAAAQIKLVSDLGGDAKNHVLSVAPYDMLVKYLDDYYEMVELKVGLELRTRVGVENYGLGVARNSQREIGFQSKDVSKILGVDTVAARAAPPDGMRAIALVAVLRKHDCESGATRVQYLAIKDATMGNMLVSLVYDKICVVVHTSLGGDLEAIDVYKEPVMVHGVVSSLGEEKTRFETIVAFEEFSRQTLTVDGEFVSYAMLGVGATKLVVNVAEGSKVHVAERGAEGLKAKLQEALRFDERNVGDDDANLLVPASFLEEYDPMGARRVRGGRARAGARGDARAALGHPHEARRHAPGGGVTYDLAADPCPSVAIVAYERSDAADDFEKQTMEIAQAGSVGRSHATYNAWYFRYWLTISQCSKDIAIGILVRLTLAAQLRHIGVSYEDLAIAGSSGVKVGMDAFGTKSADALQIPLRVVFGENGCEATYAENARNPVVLRIWTAGPWAPFLCLSNRGAIVQLKDAGATMLDNGRGFSFEQQMMGQGAAVCLLERAQRSAAGGREPYAMPYVDARDTSASKSTLVSSLETAMTFAIQLLGPDVVALKTQRPPCDGTEEPVAQRPRIDDGAAAAAAAAAAATTIDELSKRLVSASLSGSLLYRPTPSDSQLAALTVRGAVLGAETVTPAKAVKDLELDFVVAQRDNKKKGFGGQGRYSFEHADGRTRAATRLETVTAANGTNRNLFVLRFSNGYKPLYSIEDVRGPNARIKPSEPTEDDVGPPASASSMLRCAAHAAIEAGANIAPRGKEAAKWLKYDTDAEPSDSEDE